ncbi:prepilin peptidase [Wukongibacter baidiensis]
MIYLIPIPFSLVACYTDYRFKKIKNLNTYPLILIGILINTYYKGFEGFKHSALGILYAVFLVTLISSFIRLGGGDVKLIMGYASVLGKEGIQNLLITFIILSILSNIARTIKENGIKEFINEIRTEIRFLGIYKHKFKKNIGAPLLLGAYLFVYFYINSI